MKKLIGLMLALIMLVSFCACGSKIESPETTETQPYSESTLPEEITESTSDAASSPALPAQLTGKLIYFNPEEDDTSVLRGISLGGNRSGSEEFNAKEPAAEGIRCIFELNEWITVNLDTDIESGISIYVFKHNEEAGNYEELIYQDNLPGLVTIFTPEKNEEYNNWGEFYLSEDEEPGDYDFVFVYGGKAVAELVTRMYNAGELESYSDAELEALMVG